MFEQLLKKTIFQRFTFVFVERLEEELLRNIKVTGEPREQYSKPVRPNIRNGRMNIEFVISTVISNCDTGRTPL